jgi:hypothetical protein
MQCCKILFCKWPPLTPPKEGNYLSEVELFLFHCVLASLRFTLFSFCGAKTLTALSPCRQKSYLQKYFVQLSSFEPLWRKNLYVLASLRFTLFSFCGAKTLTALSPYRQKSYLQNTLYNFLPSSLCGKKISTS